MVARTSAAMAVALLLAATAHAGDPQAVERDIAKIESEARAGRPEAALAAARRVIEAARALGEPALAVRAFDQVLRVGSTHQERTEYARARPFFEEARRIAETLDDPGRKGRAEQQLGYLHLGIKDDRAALKHLERALAFYESAGDERRVAGGHMNVAAALIELERYGDALGHLHESNARLERLGDQRNLARSLGNTAEVLISMGKPAEGLPLLRRAARIQDGLDDPIGSSFTRKLLGALLRAAGDHQDARTEFQRALGDARRAGGWARILLIQGEIAKNEYDAARYDACLAVARASLAHLPVALSGHADLDAATIRIRFAEALGLGALAAHARGRTDAALTLVESLRAIDLRATLGTGTRAAPRIPKRLSDREVATREDAAAARADLEAARLSGSRTRIRDARERSDAAAEAHDTAVDSVRAIERAAVGIPEPASLATVESAMPGNTALVVFGAAAEDRPLLAVVIRRGGTSSLVLEATPADVRAVQSERGRPSPRAIETLRALVVEPLALTATDETVLVSPAGALSTVPLALLFPDRRAAFVPSASAFVASRAKRSDSRQVLAVADPDYRTHAGAERDLLPLPRTRSEVAAFADARLLGAEATEEALASELRRGPWAAVHFACHGLLDDEHPGRSSLAVTASERNDGLVTVQEVFRLPVRARLVVLSACDTGRGKVIDGAGMFGLAQAFMVSGARSVLCSLWRVDDAATSTLMRTFYAHWRPTDGTRPLPATEALRRAMEHVRSHDRWKDPYYWAAWVLWNTPE